MNKICTQTRNSEQKQKGAKGFILKEDKHVVQHKNKIEKNQLIRSYNEIMGMETCTRTRPCCNATSYLLKKVSSNAAQL